MRYSGRYGLALPEGATTPLARSVAVGELERHGGPAQTQGPNRAVAGEEGTVRSAAGPGEASADRVLGVPGSTSSSVRGRAFGAMKPLLLARPGGSAGQRRYGGHAQSCSREAAASLHFLADLATRVEGAPTEQSGSPSSWRAVGSRPKPPPRRDDSQRLGAGTTMSACCGRANCASSGCDHAPRLSRSG